MNSSEEEYFAYFTAIESLFQSKRRSFTLLSTKDWSIIQKWHEQGLPLECVLTGIEQAFQFQQRINSVTYCQAAVTAAFKQHQCRP